MVWLLLLLLPLLACCSQCMCTPCAACTYPYGLLFMCCLLLNLLLLWLKIYGR
jgi:hypothetical protein